MAILVTRDASSSPGTYSQPTFDPTSGEQATPRPQDLARLLLCLSVVDHRVSTRDRYEGDAYDAYLALAVREARMALDGATIDQILEARGDEA